MLPDHALLLAFLGNTTYEGKVAADITTARRFVVAMQAIAQSLKLHGSPIVDTHAALLDAFEQYKAEQDQPELAALAAGINATQEMSLSYSRSISELNDRLELLHRPEGASAVLKAEFKRTLIGLLEIGHSLFGTRKQGGILSPAFGKVSEIQGAVSERAAQMNAYGILTSSDWRQLRALVNPGGSLNVAVQQAQEAGNTHVTLPAEESLLDKFFTKRSVPVAAAREFIAATNDLLVASGLDTEFFERYDTATLQTKELVNAFNKNPTPDNLAKLVDLIADHYLQDAEFARVVRAMRQAVREEAKKTLATSSGEIEVANALFGRAQETLRYLESRHQDIFGDRAKRGPIFAAFVEITQVNGGTTTHGSTDLRDRRVTASLNKIEAHLNNSRVFPTIQQPSVDPRHTGAGSSRDAGRVG